MRSVIKTYLNEFGIWYNEEQYDHRFHDFSMCWGRDKRVYNIFINLDRHDERVEIDCHYLFEIPADRMTETSELLHRINEENSYGRLILLWDERKVIYRTDFFYPGNPDSRKAMLHAYFTASVRLIKQYELLIADVAYNDETPAQAIATWKQLAANTPGGWYPEE